ncbi:MFS transporter [Paenibacillus sp. CC-CFT747]|nr:MFS transporter [Paenibacillus sp. CC-CFT747]
MNESIQDRKARRIVFVPGFGRHREHSSEDEEEREGREGAGLTPQTRLLLLVNALFGTANALSGTFVSIYLWKARNDFAMIAWFAVYQQVFMALTFWIAGKWVKEHNKMNSLRLGIALSALFYVLVLLLGVRSVDYIFWLGSVQGLASGFFWLAFNVVYFEVTNPDNRDRFNGWAGLWGSVAGMVAPWVSGFLITHWKGTGGYRLIFTLSLVIFLVGVVLSFWLRKRKVQTCYDWWFPFRKMADRSSRRVLWGLAAQGIREGVYSFLIGLLVYLATKNEMKLGNFSLITSGVALVSFWAAGRWFRPRFRKWGMLLGILAMMGVVLPLFWRVSYGTLLLFGIGTALFIPLYTLPGTSVVFDWIGRQEDGGAGEWNMWPPGRWPSTPDVYSGRCYLLR